MISAPSFSTLPQQAQFTLGGFTGIRAEAWRAYLESAIKHLYPQYDRKNSANGDAGTRWREEESCVLAALEKYMLVEFGVLVPEDNLFKFYNPNGDGISPDMMIEAISAVIEPLGFEVDKILVTDQVLAKGLGNAEKVVNISWAGEFEGQAGIGMINIAEGYSHAFFWAQMDSRKFYKEQFRMAVLVKRKDEGLTRHRSAIDGIEDYCRLIQEYSRNQNQSVATAFQIKLKSIDEETDLLLEYIYKQENRGSLDFREVVDKRLSSITSLLVDLGHDANMPPGCIEISYLHEAGNMIRKVIREIAHIQ